ncbi:hypothetical protein Tco_0227836 [Tanacetum coccineum]
MPPKRTSTSETPSITLDSIQQLIANGIATALKAQAATMESASNPNRNNTGPYWNPVTKMGKLKSLSFQPYLLQCTAEQLTSFAGLSGLNRSIEGNVTASKPQTLEEATNIAQRLMDTDKRA